jgi:hypothetical protein
LVRQAPWLKVCVEGPKLPGALYRLTTRLTTSVKSATGNYCRRSTAAIDARAFERSFG